MTKTHMQDGDTEQTMCGRKLSKYTTDEEAVTCAKCLLSIASRRPARPEGWSEWSKSLGSQTLSPNTIREKLGMRPTYNGDICQNCDKPIKVQIFRGLGFCSDDCRKALGKDID